MEDTAFTMTQATAVILNKGSKAARNLKYWAERVEKTMEQMLGTPDTISRSKALSPKGNPVIKEARRRWDVIKPINLP